MVADEAQKQVALFIQEQNSETKAGTELVIAPERSNTQGGMLVGPAEGRFQTGHGGVYRDLLGKGSACAMLAHNAGGRKSRFPGFQSSGLAITANSSQIARRGLFHFRRIHAIFFEERGSSDKIMPGGVLNGGGKILVTTAFYLRSQGFADRRRKSYMMTIHTTTLWHNVAQKARCRLRYPNQWRKAW
jgi:hypothetical protein